MAKHQLIGAQVSLYTGKVRAYLDFKAIPYTEVLATREVYRDVILPRTGVRFIPVLISDDDIAVQDSTEIIELLEARYPEPSVYPAGPLQRWVALMLEAYADEWLVMPAMHYRWNVPENRAFAIAEFGRLSAPEASPSEQRMIGERLSGPFAGALGPLGVRPENLAAVEASYLGFLVDFERHLASQPFLFGTRPSIADFAFYGPLYAHLYRDPASGRLMRQRAPGVAQWVERMRAPQPRSGEFLSNDVLPATLEPMLARMVQELIPVLASTQGALARLRGDALEAPLPRTIGTHEFRLGEVTSERAIYPFNLWRWQRAADQYQALNAETRAHASALLRRIDGSPWMTEPASPRLIRKDNRLFIAP
ncbi:MAG TPA: glutathione S-transferase family protein [Polyangiales bacterium]|nr:glutathione S-transferase family protein [Polyangiales bacterium]